jgi:hypothetical protein
LSYFNLKSDTDTDIIVYEYKMDVSNWDLPLDVNLILMMTYIYLLISSFSGTNHYAYRELKYDCITPIDNNN